MTETNVNQANQQLGKIAEAIWQRMIDQSVYLCLSEGLPIKRLPDLSVKQAEQNVAFAQATLAELEQIPLEQLTYGNQVIHQALHWDLAQGARELDLYWYQFPVTPYSAPFWIVNQVFTSFDFQSAEDLDHYLELLDGYPIMLDAMQAKLKGQVERGIVVPQEELGLVTPFLQALLQEPAKNLLSVAEERLAQLPASRVAAFGQALEQSIAKQINPRFQALLDYLGTEYSAKAPQQVGLGQYPGGLEAYGLLIQQHTTLSLTAQEIHEMGQAAVQELNLQMADIRRQIGFEGTKAEFHQFLKTDQRFFAKTPDEVGERMMAFIRRIEPKISSVFAQVPQAPYGVKRLDPELEGAMTFGYYDMPKPNQPVGYYCYNGSQLDQRSFYNAGGLIYHELMPGHHFHIARQRENENLPDVRRLSTHSAFTEGWAEYAANLAGELGMYDDPYDQYGRLAMEMFLSNRLVVDTGMNALGWSRARAAAMMQENCLETDAQIYTETLRYSVDMPAQALAYKVGSIKMHELRRKVEQALGADFDLRQYHEAVLEHGSMPLEVLERHMDNWVQMS